MQRNHLRLAIAATLALSAQVQAIDLGNPAKSYDGSRSLKYPNGDKPVPPVDCTFPAGWTEFLKGTGTGEVCGNSATEFQITASGSDDEGDIYGAYKTCGSDDCEVIAKVPLANEWVGHQEAFTAFLVGISEGTGDSAWYVQAWVTPDGRLRCKAGTPGPDEYNSQTAPNQLPSWLGVTHDDSADDFGCWQSLDGINWSRYGTVLHAATEPNIGYVAATSHEVTATTTAVLSEIDLNLSLSIYTPTPDPPPVPPNNAPVCTGFPNQSLTQGVTITPINSGLYCSDVDADILSYSATGLSGRGFAIDPSTGIITGTPNSTAFGAQPFTVSVTATDPDSAASTASFQVSVAPPSSSGDTFVLTTSSSQTVNCASMGIGPGDTIQLWSGVRTTPIQFTNCNGTAGSRIKIRNDLTAGSKATLRTAAGRPRYAFQFTDNNSYIDADFQLGWSGQAAGRCGIADDGRTRYTSGCGLFLDGTTNGPAQDMVRIAGSGKFISIKGVEASGNWTCVWNAQNACTTQDTNYTEAHGITTNDSQYCRSEHPGEWREGIEIAKGYWHNFNDTAMYIGNNVNKTCGTSPIVGNHIFQRDIWIHHNLIDTIGEGGAKVKSVPGDDPLEAIVEFNHFIHGGGSTESKATGHNSNAFAFFEASGTFRYNFIDGTANDGKTGPGFACGINYRSLALMGNQVCNAYGNDITNTSGPGMTGSSAPANSGCNNGTACNSTTAGLKFFYDFNTVVDAGRESGQAISLNGATLASRASYNIAAGNTQISAGTAGTVTGNRTGTVVSQAFTNAGAKDFTLTTNSPAKNGGQNNNCPPQDISGLARPKGSVCDQGADEFNE